MGEQLRIIDNIKIIEEHDNVAFFGKLICYCGCELFRVQHTGKVTKGILFPYLIKKDKQIVIKAICKDCGKSIIILDSGIDGLNPYKHSEYPEEQFLLKNVNDFFEITLKYNYYSKDYKTNKFVDCFIEIKNNDMKKIKQLYEG